MKQLVITPHRYRDTDGFRIHEPNRNGWGTDAFCKTLDGARLFAIGTLEGDFDLTGRALENETKPTFTTALYDGLIANAEKQGLIRYRGLPEKRSRKAKKTNLHSRK